MALESVCWFNRFPWRTPLLYAIEGAKTRMWRAAAFLVPASEDMP